MTGGRPLGQYSPPNEGLRGSSWAFDAAIADADPGSGNFRLNNATQASATEIYISNEAESGANLGSVLTSLVSGDSIYIGDAEDPDNYHLFSVTGPVVTATGYRKIPVVAADSGNDLVDTAPANFSIYQPQGAGGGGTSFSESWEYKDETTAADPGAGNFRLDNLNPGLATEIYIADESKNGIDFSLLLNALQPGDLVFLQNLETTTEALLATIDTITDNTGWFTLEITVADNNGAAWTDGKEFGFLFSTSTSGFVDLTTNQTIGGEKTFQDNAIFESLILGNEIQERTTDAGIIFRANVAAAAAQGTTTFDGESWRITSPRNGLGDSLNIGWLDSGDATTPEQFAIARSSLSGFLFWMPNAPNPQIIAGSNDNTGNVFIDGNGNKDIRFNTLDTGPNRDNRVVFGFGGIVLLDDSGDDLEIRAPTAITPGGWRLTLPADDGDPDEFLQTDGSGNTTWAAIVQGIAALPGVFTESGSTNITQTTATIGLDTEELDPDGNYSIVGGEVTVASGGYYDGDYSIPVNDDSTGGTTRGAVQSFMERDQGTGTWIEIPGSRGQDYHREAGGGSGVNGAFIAQLADGEAVRLRVRITSTTDVSSEVGQSSLNIHRIRLN